MKSNFFHSSSPVTYFRFVLVLVDLNKTIRAPINSSKSGSTLQIQEQYLGDRQNIGDRVLLYQPISEGFGTCRQLPYPKRQNVGRKLQKLNYFILVYQKKKKTLLRLLRRYSHCLNSSKPDNRRRFGRSKEILKWKTQNTGSTSKRAIDKRIAIHIGLKGENRMEVWR